MLIWKGFQGILINNKKGKVQNMVYGFIDILCVYFIYSGACILFCSLKGHAGNC